MLIRICDFARCCLGVFLRSFRFRLWLRGGSVGLLGLRTRFGLRTGLGLSAWSGVATLRAWRFGARLGTRRRRKRPSLPHGLASFAQLGRVLIEASPNVCLRLVLAKLLPILLALALGHRSDWN